MIARHRRAAKCKRAAGRRHVIRRRHAARSRCAADCSLGKLVLKLLLGVCTLFIGTFIVYFFNLDMKLTSKMEPFMLKHYDRIDRDKRL